MRKTIFLFCCFLATIINAQNWVSTGISSTKTQSVYDIEIHNNMLFASVNNDGLIQSSDDGNTWSVVNQTDFVLNPNDKRVSHILSTGSALYVTTLFAGTSTSMIYKSTDNGATFTLDIDGLPKATNDNTRVMNLTKMFLLDDYLYAVFNGGNYKKKLTDTTWQNVSNTATMLSGYYASYNGVFYAFPSYALYKSTDKGTTWTKPVNTGLPQLFLPNNFAVNPTNGRIYVSGKGLTEQTHKLLYSDDEGETWTSLNIESNLGTNWINQPQTITEIFAYENVIQLGLANDTNNSGAEVLISKDYGVSFSSDKTGILDKGFGTTEPIKFKLKGDNLFMAVNYNDIYKKEVSTLSTYNFEKENFTVSPNPLTISSTIKVKSPLYNATISLFNILGKKVMEKKNISGYSFHLQRYELTKGIYFLKIDDKNQKFSPKKIMVVD